MLMIKKKLGLVFSGGGAKGAYLLGVWQAIRELGLEKDIEGVAGVSIGALMGYMFAVKEYELSCHLWETSKYIERSIQTKPQGIIHKVIGKNNVNALENLKSNNYLSSKKIDNLLNQMVDINKLKTSKCKCYVTCHNIHTKGPESFLLNRYSEEEVKQILKASSAIPLLFKKVKLNNKSYYDGGLSDNTPIRPLYENDYNIIIVVYLDDKGHIDYRFFPKTIFIEISPQGGIGNFRDGVLNFNAYKIDELIKKGYKEARRVLLDNLEILKKDYI